MNSRRLGLWTRKRQITFMLRSKTKQSDKDGFRKKDPKKVRKNNSSLILGPTESEYSTHEFAIRNSHGQKDGTSSYLQKVYTSMELFRDKRFCKLSRLQNYGNIKSKTKGWWSEPMTYQQLYHRTSRHNASPQGPVGVNCYD